MTSPRGIRNRNPGNIVVSLWTERQPGFTGPEPQGRFATFQTMAFGVQALIRLLIAYREIHNLTTVRGIISRWAPPNENNTAAYVAAVSKSVGVGADDPLPFLTTVYEKLARAIVVQENGRDAAMAVTDEDFAEAMDAVFGPPSLPSLPSKRERLREILQKLKRYFRFG